MNNARCPYCGHYLVFLKSGKKCLCCGRGASDDKNEFAFPPSVALETNAQIVTKARINLLKNIDGSYDYCIKRGITPDVMDKWELGYAPENFFYMKPFWWNRIIFPIRSNDGKSVIGFGGRTIKAVSKEDGVPKYLNSPASDIYNKSESLYGYSLAQQGEKIYLCEGYIDVLSMSSHNYNAVAALGTALTPQQALILRKKSEHICLCYDSDKPGQKAAVHAALLLTKSPTIPLIVSRL